jgi:glycosyltransferase involved in cell wall biosynthesis
MSNFDLLISSTSGFAHHARKREGARHIAYCHTPPRFLWRPDQYFRGRPGLRAALRPLLATLRAGDLAAAAGVDRYVAVSSHIARRVRSVYGREAEVVHPPVDCGRFRPSDERSGRFLVVSRLVRAKRVDLVIEAANERSLPLDIIGLGPDEARLRRLAGPSVKFLGWQPDAVVAEAMARATAIVVAGEEDFGLATAEAQAAGRPPVAFAQSGAADIVEDGVSGYLFEEATPASVMGAMLRARDGCIDTAALVASARRFDVPEFERNLDLAVRTAPAGERLPEPLGGATMAISGTRA